MYPFEVRGARKCARFALQQTQMTKQQVAVMYEAGPHSGNMSLGWRFNVLLTLVPHQAA